MAKTFLELLAQVKGILPVINGGTGLSTSGVDATKFLRSDGAGGFTMQAVPLQNSFQLDGGASNTNYTGVAQIDLGGSI